ncbi:MAG: DUF305 domain-containing protein [Nocardioides marinisabuli]|uniref:DUF305 domain-containing protein n=1 Tax=Nocardioides marinisabuli TaxID=419476 RepID=UPI003219C17D
MHPQPKTLTRVLSALALSFALGGLAACGNDTYASETAQVSTTEHNAADITFAESMIEHHAQALSMVDLTIGRDLDPEVRGLAEDIRAAQGPEIETMAEWLTTWGEDVPDAMRNLTDPRDDPSDTSEGTEDMDEMPGMMTADAMTALENASDTDFQNMWLQMMIEHHEGAVEMAETEQEEGQFKEAVDLAGLIADSQTQEIGTMKDLLDG